MAWQGLLSWNEDMSLVASTFVLCFFFFFFFCIFCLIVDVCIYSNVTVGVF